MEHLNTPIGLVHNASDEDKAARQRDLDQARAHYEYDHQDGFPGFVRGIPEPEVVHAHELQKLFVESPEDEIGLQLSKIEGWLAKLFEPGKPLEMYEHLYPLRHPAKPSVAERWLQDVEFARQRVQGIHPNGLVALTELPKALNVTETHIAGLLPVGETLASQLSAGRLFGLDLAIVDGLPVRAGTTLAAPIGLFWLDPSDTLRPLAIQLSQAADSLVFTPNDHPGLWTLVKSHFQAADMAQHEANVHLLHTHLIMEAFNVATHRELPPQHPLYGLLMPHFRGTIAVNYLARKVLLAKGGWIDQTMSAAYEGTVELTVRGFKAYHFDQRNLLTDLANRGVGSAKVLPYYPYRDDASEVYGIIESYVKEVVYAFYATDKDVRQDTEVQAWIALVAAEDGGRVPGIPALNSRDALIRVVTQVVFTASAEHAAVNNGQYDYIGFVLNFPAAVTAPLPTNRLDRSDAQLAEAYPSRRLAAKQIGFVHVLSTPTTDGLSAVSSIAEHDAAAAPPNWQHHPDCAAALARFQARLHVLSDWIQARNASAEVPYTYQDPAQIAQSVAI